MHKFTSVIHWVMWGGTSLFHLDPRHLLAAVRAKLTKAFILREGRLKLVRSPNIVITRDGDISHSKTYPRIFLISSTTLGLKQDPCVQTCKVSVFSRGWQEMNGFKAGSSARALCKFIVAEPIPAIDANSLWLLINLTPACVCDLNPFPTCLSVLLY